MAADLHIHSTYSDGTERPEELVRQAKNAGLKTISITDHDIVDGIPSALNEGKNVGLEVIPGIEFTTEASLSEIHILGYFIDIANPLLIDELNKIQEGRTKRIYKIVNKLKELKIDIEPEEVLEIAGTKAPGRPHVARALIKKGVVTSFKEAFARFLDNRGPAYVPHYKLVPAEAVRLIVKIGGIAVFAHPAVSNCDELIPALITEGLKGIEVFYGGHRPEQTEHYLKIAEKYNLFMTGGSDYHGKDAGRVIIFGSPVLEDKYVDAMRQSVIN
ncbi:MAG: PHP domain-containing protein [Candidatus Margulisiibacteriota bacterium]